jgi:hypothetical protein
MHDQAERGGLHGIRHELHLCNQLHEASIAAKFKLEREKERSSPPSRAESSRKGTV